MAFGYQPDPGRPAGVPHGRLAPLWVRRVAGCLVALVAAYLVVYEAVGIIDGLHRHRDKTTVSLSTMILVQGLVGLPALLLALSALPAFGVTINPRRSLRTAALSLALAVPLGLTWFFLVVGAYGS
jgi:hypothetical protein